MVMILFRTSSTVFGRVIGSMRLLVRPLSSPAALCPDTPLHPLASLVRHMEQN